MQYGNPYFAQPFQQIQPYQDRLAQLQNSYQQAMPYGQAQIQQPMPQVPQIPMLQGQMVDGIDTVKAKDVDMSGNPVYYPKTDGTEIYRKQLQADGRSRIFVYLHSAWVPVFPTFVSETYSLFRKSQNKHRFEAD